MFKEEFYFKSSEESTDYSYGYNPYHRPLDMYIKNGVINLDKPRGPSSHQVTSWVREILEIKKIGHAGTLDI